MLSVYFLWLLSAIVLKSILLQVLQICLVSTFHACVGLFLLPGIPAPLCPAGWFLSEFVPHRLPPFLGRGFLLVKQNLPPFLHCFSSPCLFTLGTFSSNCLLTSLSLQLWCEHSEQDLCVVTSAPSWLLRCFCINYGESQMRNKPVSTLGQTTTFMRLRA